MRRAQELIDEVRELGNDQDASLISDEMMLKWLWEGANQAALEGQLLEYPYLLNTIPGQTEYALPFEEGDIKTICYVNGNEPVYITKKPMEFAFSNNNTGTNPRMFYTKLNAALLTGILADGEIEIQQANSKIVDDYKYVIGFDSVPGAAMQVIVTMAIPHPRLKDVQTKVVLPETAQAAVVSWALWKLYKKEKSYAEASSALSDFNDMIDKIRERAITGGIMGNLKVKKPRADFEFWGHEVIPTDTGMIGI